MKKIIGAAVIAALAAGAATADVSIKMNYRTRATAFDYTKTDDGTNTKETTNWFDLDGYAASQDNINFVASGDKAGVQLQFMPTATTKANDGWRINTYNAWLKFGDLKLAAGVWKDGYADGAYRVKKDHDAGNFEGVDSERFKLGSAFKGMPSTFMDNMVAHNGGDNNLSAFAELPLDLSGIKLNFLVAAVSNEYDKVSDDDGDTTFHTGVAARVQLGVEDVLDAEVVFKQPNRAANAVGLYIRPKVLDNLDLTVGGAVEFISGGSSAYHTFNGQAFADDAVNWNIDLRVRYAVNSSLSFYTFNKISATDRDAGLKVGSGIAGTTGKNGAFGSSVSVRNMMWNMLGVRYKINDLASVYLNGGIMGALQTADGDDNGYLEWRVTPGVQLYAASNASINVGCAISGGTMFADVGDDKTVFSVAVPVIFRVKM